MNELSNQQVLDAVWGFHDTANAAVGREHVVFDRTRVPAPCYEDAALAYDADAFDVMFDIPKDENARRTLAHFPGLRVTVGIAVASRQGGTRMAHFPGIVLQSSPEKDPSIGILQAPPDVITFPQALVEHQTRPLSELKQNLLAKLYGLQDPNAGNHAGDGKTSVAETAHGALIAVTDPSRILGLHDRVHEYVARGLAASISGVKPGLTAESPKIGASDILVGGTIRAVREGVIPAIDARVGSITVSREHQLSPEVSSVLGELSAGQFAVGMTLAAVRSKASINFPQPDLSRGMEAMILGATNY